MLYMFLITYNPTIEPEPGAPASRQPEHAAYEKELRAEGTYEGGAALMPPRVRPIVRVDHKGNASKVDGPFAETKELIGGYFVIDCKDEADAVERAKRIPTDNTSWIDIQQVVLWHPK